MAFNTDGQTTEIVTRRSGDIAVYESILDAVPEVEEGSYESILLSIANAQSVYELDAPFRADSLASLKDDVIQITSIRRAPSEFEGGLGVYLIVDAIVESTGDKVTVTTGSVSVVAQLAKAYVLDALPLRCIPRVAARPTKKGFYPMHLEIVTQQPRRKDQQEAKPEDYGGDDQPF